MPSHILKAEGNLGTRFAQSKPLTEEMAKEALSIFTAQELDIVRWKAQRVDIVLARIPDEPAPREINSPQGGVAHSIGFIISGGEWASAITNDIEDVETYKQMPGAKVLVVGKISESNGFTNIRPYRGFIILQEAEEDAETSTPTPKPTKTSTKKVVSEEENVP